MEPTINNSKPEINSKDRLFIYILIILNLFLLFALPYSMLSAEGGLFNSDKSFILGISGIGLLFISFIVSPISIFFAYKYVFRRKTTVLSVMLFIISFLSFPLVGSPLLMRLPIFIELVK
jgi:hypothetical protein